MPGPPPPVSTAFVPSLARLQAQREVLIRVVGPSLASFGVTGVWSDPDFALYRETTPAQVNEGHYANGPGGNSGFQKIFTVVGAFPLLPGSKDAADIVRLDPGAYTIVCNPSAGDPGGEALIEVYFLP